MRKDSSEASKRPSKRPKPGPGRRRTVNPQDVLDNFHRLFRDLDIGISRSRVTRPPRGARPTDSLYEHATAIGDLLTRWHQDASYLDEGGNPAAIRPQGQAPSFQSLARHTLPALDPKHLLSELVRLGALSIDADNFVHVLTRSFPIFDDRRLASEHTLVVLDGFIRTLRHNLHSPATNAAQLFHRIVWSDDFDTTQIQALKVRAKREGRNFLESFDDWLTSHSAPRTEGAGAHHPRRTRVSIGVYLSIDE